MGVAEVPGGAGEGAPVGGEVAGDVDANAVSDVADAANLCAAAGGGREEGSNDGVCVGEECGDAGGEREEAVGAHAAVVKETATAKVIKTGRTEVSKKKMTRILR